MSAERGQSWWRRAFAIDDERPDEVVLEREEEVLAKIADAVVKRRMAVPALMFLETVRPLNFVGSQVMVFLQPFITTLFTVRDYDLIREMLERRDSVGRLIEKIEKVEADRQESERAEKQRRKRDIMGRRDTGNR